MTPAVPTSVPETISFVDAAAELGLTHSRFRSLLQHRGGPKSLPKPWRSRKPNYYIASDIRAWWQKVKDEV